MFKTFRNPDISFDYELKKSPKAKRIRIAVKKNKAVVVTIPRWIPYLAGELFLTDKADWVHTVLTKKTKNTLELPKLKDWQSHKEPAMKLVKTIIAKYEQHYPYRYNSITIRNPQSRWGSCSSRGNLNFNYRIQFIAKELAEYIVVHELCHLKQMNHSPQFWNLVAKTFPHYRELRKQLRTIHYQ